MAALSPVHRPGCARLGMARLNAFRLNVYEPVALAYVNGVPVTGGAAGTGLYIEGATIDQILNDQTDTASFRMRGVVPVAGQPIAVYSGEVGLGGQLFGGRILETTQLYESRKENRAHDIRCVDPTWLLNRRTVLASYVNQSATAIVLDLIARFARGVTTRAVTLGLPVVDEITFTNEYLPVCLTAICERIGGHWYLGYDSDLHVFLQEGPDANSITDAAPHGAADLALTEDLSQVVTKVIGRGQSANAAVDTPVGSTELPVDEGLETVYSPTGGLVEVGTQVLTYTGVRGRSGGGALVGSGNAPSSAPNAIQVYDYNPPALAIGPTYQYAISFVNESGTPPTLGESLVGPIKSVTITGVVPRAPGFTTVRDSIYTSGSPQPVIGATYYYRLSIRWSYGTEQMGPVSGPYVYNGKLPEFQSGYNLPSPEGIWHFPDLDGYSGSLPGYYTQVIIHRNKANTGPSGPFYNAGSFDVPQGTYYGKTWYTPTASYNPPDGDLATLSPTSNGPGLNAIELRALPISALSSVKQRKIYRTAANGSQLKLAATIANNTTTSWLDQVTDAALGATAPTSDNSGITDNRQVPAGVTELPVSDTAPFSADGGAGGGWIRIGTMPVRYTGIATGKLTGIPATGNGAVTATVRYGAQILVQPRLGGIPASGTGAIVNAILRGDAVAIRLEKTDTAARDVMAARLGGTAEDGIIELVVSDSRFDLVELQDHLDATLLDRKDPQLTLTFTSRDLTLQVGRLITVNTTEPPINGTFRIHKIALSEIAVSGGRALVHPLKTVEASSKIYKFTDLLRRLRSVEAGVR
jgi:hypothetical protein